MSARHARRTVSLLVAGSAACAVALMSGPTQVQASAGFACAPGLQEACALVLGPVCRKPFQPCY